MERKKARLEEAFAGTVLAARPLRCISLWLHCIASFVFMSDPRYAGESINDPPDLC
jgi:hypothetical protein